MSLTKTCKGRKLFTESLVDDLTVIWGPYNVDGHWMLITNSKTVKFHLVREFLFENRTGMWKWCVKWFLILSQRDLSPHSLIFFIDTSATPSVNEKVAYISQDVGYRHDKFIFLTHKLLALYPLQVVFLGQMTFSNVQFISITKLVKISSAA